MTQPPFSIKLINRKTEGTHSAALHWRSQRGTGGTKWNKLGFAESHGKKSAFLHFYFNISSERKKFCFQQVSLWGWY